MDEYVVSIVIPDCSSAVGYFHLFVNGRILNIQINKDFNVNNGCLAKICLAYCRFSGEVKLYGYCSKRLVIAYRRCRSYGLRNNFCTFCNSTL